MASGGHFTIATNQNVSPKARRARAACRAASFDKYIFELTKNSTRLRKVDCEKVRANRREIFS